MTKKKTPRGGKRSGEKVRRSQKNYTFVWRQELKSSCFAWYNHIGQIYSYTTPITHKEVLSVKRYSVLIAVAVFVLSLAGCTTAPSPGSTGKSRPVTNAADVKIIEMISGEKESSYRVEVLLPTTDLSSVGQPLADRFRRNGMNSTV